MIDEWAFGYATLQNITFPSSLLYVQNSAFRNSIFSTLNFSMSNNLVFDGSVIFGFIYTTNLLIMPSTLKIIPSQFLWGSTISRFNIPRDCDEIQYGAFVGCMKLTSITSDSPNFIVHNGILYSADFKTLIKYPVGLQTDIVPTVSVLSDAGAFSSISIVNFVLKSPVTVFGNSCFRATSSMISCDLSCSKARNIPPAIFLGCKKLTNVIFPNTITSIDYQCFYECTSIYNIYLPAGVTLIGDLFITLESVNIYYCGIYQIRYPRKLPSGCSIHVTSSYPYANLFNQAVADKNYECTATKRNCSFINPIAFECTIKQICYTRNVPYYLLTPFILILES